jgi:ribosomal protein S18 acetylase RimI-like enzyme
VASIRVYCADDQVSVIALWERCGLVRPWNVPADDIAAKIAFQPELLFVAEDHQSKPGDAPRTVGSVMAGYEGHRGWINYLAVDPRLRRSGLGRALMAHAEAALRGLGCPKINLQIRETNTDVIAFYRALGFEIDAAVSLGKRLDGR